MLTENNKICSYKNQKSYLGEEWEEDSQSFSRYRLRMSRKKSSFPRYNVCM